MALLGWGLKDALVKCDEPLMMKRGREDKGYAPEIKYQNITQGSSQAVNKRKKYDNLKDKLDDFMVKSEHIDCWHLKSNSKRNMLIAYPTIDWGGKRISARKAAYGEYIGPIPDGSQVRTVCSNFGCLNPEHFELEDRLNPEIDTPMKRMLKLIVIGSEQECWTLRNRSLYKTPTIDFRDPNSESKTLLITTARPLSYEHFIGPVPEGMWVKTSCDHAGCLNPKHFFLSPHKMGALGKRGVTRNCLKNEDEIRDIKARLAAGEKRSAIAKLHGVSWGFVYRIETGAGYAHIK